MKDIEELVLFTNELAELSRSIILSHPILDMGYEIKEDGSPVTRVDREVEQKLRERIDARYPHHGVLGEEFPSRDIDAERVWLIDPIDGTKAYATGVPVYGTLIALADGGRIVVGVMDFPATDDRWIGGRDYPTRWNDKRVTTRRCIDVAHAVVAPGDPKRGSPEEQVGSSRLTDASCFALWGAGCYSFAMVASGKVDIAMDTDLDPFDFAAPAAVVEGAGGSATDWHGESLTMESEGCALFLGDPNLLESVLSMLQP